MRFFIAILLSGMLLSACQRFEISADTNDLFHLTEAGTEIPVLVRGNTASGKFIVFINGGPGLSSIDVAELDLFGWQEIEDEFAVAYYDQRGTGNSQGNMDPSTLTMEQYVTDLHKIVQVIRDKYDHPSIFLLGHSFGGYTGTEYLLNHDGIAGWINVNGLNVVKVEDQWEYRRDFFVNVANEKITAGEDTIYWQEALDWISAIPVIETREQKDQWRDYIGQFPGDGIIPEEDVALPVGNLLRFLFFSSYNPVPAYLSSNWKIVADSLYEDVKDENLLPELHEISTPTLLIWGRYDDLIPPEIASDIHDSLGTPLADKSLLVLKYSGHQPFVNQPAEFNSAVIDFVRRYD